MTSGTEDNESKDDKGGYRDIRKTSQCNSIAKRLSSDKCEVLYEDVNIVVCCQTV